MEQSGEGGGPLLGRREEEAPSLLEGGLRCGLDDAEGGVTAGEADDVIL